MKQAQPVGQLIWREELQLRGFSVAGIYPWGEKIVLLSFGFGTISPEEHKDGKVTPKFVMADVLSADCSEREAYLLTFQDMKDLFAAQEADCYIENGRFFINTKKYVRWENDKQIGKIIELTGKGLIEIGQAPPPEQYIFNENKIYEFGERQIKMKSPFIMECTPKGSKETLWKTKLRAYLYSEVVEQDGIVYFGVHGNGKGGRMYALKLDTGEVLWKYESGGTERFFFTPKGILLADSHYKPVFICPATGKELGKVDFGDFEITPYQQMYLINNRLYAIATSPDGLSVVSAAI